VTRTRDSEQSPTLAALEGLLASDRLARGNCDVPVPCGAVGWLSYDVARELETLPDAAVDDRGLPVSRSRSTIGSRPGRCPPMAM